MTLIEPKFRPIRASIMVILYQLGLGIICGLFFHFLSIDSTSASTSINLASMFIGSAIYASRYEKKKPGILEPYIKRVAFNVLLINFLLVGLMGLLLLLAGLNAGKTTSSDYAFMFGIGALFATLGALIIYFTTKSGLKMGINQSRREAAKKTEIAN